jgi:hypothetical protein
VALRTAGLPRLGELRSMRVGMAIFASLRCPFELRLVGARRRFVTGAASNGPVRAQKRELCFRMVETAYIRPRLCAVAGLTTERRAIRAAPGHAVLKFTLMRISVASGAALILEMEGEHLVRWPARA